MTARSAAVLAPADAPQVVDVLVEAFRDYPVMRFVIGEADDYERRLHTLVGFFVEARVHRGEMLLGVGDRTDLDGAALVSRAGGLDSEALARVRRTVWAELGEEARARYAAFGDATRAFDPGRPNLHLNMVGVRDRARGSGVGRILLERVHELSLADPDSTGVTLTTENEANLPLYRHFGYRVVGEAAVAPELHTWGFFRPDPE